MNKSTQMNGISGLVSRPFETHQGVCSKGSSLSSCSSILGALPIHWAYPCSRPSYFVCGTVKFFVWDDLMGVEVNRIFTESLPSKFNNISQGESLDSQKKSNLQHISSRTAWDFRKYGVTVVHKRSGNSREAHFSA
mmetsp:Transcript_9325/g.34526  ORF Transcript_9325/g.34526 Transcript_9325/m.34526 type:complete len:136 (+) Transcript_9325:37-444(+)